MRITLNTPARLADLLTHLRERGCIAWLDEEARCVHVATPSEADALAAIVDAWRDGQDGLAYELRD